MSPAALQGEGGLPRGAAAPAVLCRPQCPLWHPSKTPCAPAPAWKGEAVAAAAVATGALACGFQSQDHTHAGRQHGLNLPTGGAVLGVGLSEDVAEVLGDAARARS